MTAIPKAGSGFKSIFEEVQNDKVAQREALEDAADTSDEEEGVLSEDLQKRMDAITCSLEKMLLSKIDNEASKPEKISLKPRDSTSSSVSSVDSESATFSQTMGLGGSSSTSARSPNRPIGPSAGFSLASPSEAFKPKSVSRPSKPLSPERVTLQPKSEKPHFMEDESLRKPAVLFTKPGFVSAAPSIAPRVEQEKSSSAAVPMDLSSQENGKSAKPAASPSPAKKPSAMKQSGKEQKPKAVSFSSHNQVRTFTSAMPQASPLAPPQNLNSPGGQKMQVVPTPLAQRTRLFLPVETQPAQLSQQMPMSNFTNSSSSSLSSSSSPSTDNDTEMAVSLDRELTTPPVGGAFQDGHDLSRIRQRLFDKRELRRTNPLAADRVGKVKQLRKEHKEKTAKANPSGFFSNASN